MRNFNELIPQEREAAVDKYGWVALYLTYPEQFVFETADEKAA